LTSKVLVVDDDEMTLRIVQAALTKAGFEVVSGHNGREAFQRISEHKPDLLILDVLMPDINGFEICTRLRQNPETAKMPIMMLTALDTVEEKVKGFQAGADDYLPKPFSPDELVMRVRVLFRRYEPTAQVETQAETGKVISVYSLRGGVGVSTLAANLATGLTQLWGSPAVLVDLVMAAGQAALMLNMPFHHSWDDLSPYPVDDIDEDVLQQVLLTHANQTRLLASSPNPENAENLRLETVEKVIELLRMRFEHIIIDLPHDFSATTITALDYSDQILGVLAPELASVRSMGIALSTFEKLNYPPDKTLLALNWTFQKNGLGRKEIENALHHPIRLVVPFAPEQIVSAINMGAPMVISETESPLTAFFEDLCFMVSVDRLRTKRPAEPSKSWQRVYARIKQRQKK